MFHPTTAVHRTRQASPEYDLDANGGKVGVVLTQEMLDGFYVQQWWGGTFILNADNVKCTKITLQ